MHSPRALALALVLPATFLLFPSAARADGGGMNVYAGTGTLASNKQKAFFAAKSLGASYSEIILILAVGMGETDNFSVDQRDATKDQAGLAANYTAFNVNGDMLTHLYGRQDFSKYNGQDNIALGVRALLDAFRKWTPDRFLAFHRGGSTAFEDGQSYGAADYKARIHQVAKYLERNPQHLTDNYRVCFCIPHV